MPNWPLPCRLLPLLALALAAGARAEISPDTERLLQDINEVRREHGVPAVGLTLVSPAAVLWSGGIGYADLASRRPAGPDTLYRIEALSRTVASLATLMAVERGWLSLDDPLKMLLPDAALQNPWADTHPVRIAQLLEHTAGLLDSRNAEPGEGSETVAPTTAEPEATVCRWPPGLYASYSGAGVGFAVEALQHVIDLPYEQFVRRGLFAPLGMQTSGFGVDPASKADLASAYDSDGKTVRPFWHSLLQRSDSVIASPRELAALLQLLLNRGWIDRRVLLDESSLQRMETPRTTLAAQLGLSFGYGLGNEQSLHGGFLFYGQGGEADGHLSHYAYSHELESGYLVVINARQPAALQQIRERIEDYLVRDRTPPRPPELRLDAHRLRSLSGRYRPLTWRFADDDPAAHPGRDELELVVSAGRLVTRTPDGQQQALLPVSRDLFRRADQPLASVAFFEYGTDIYLLGELGNYLRVSAPAGAATQR